MTRLCDRGINVCRTSEVAARFLNVIAVTWFHNAVQPDSGTFRSIHARLPVLTRQTIFRQDLNKEKEKMAVEMKKRLAFVLFLLTSVALLSFSSHGTSHLSGPAPEKADLTVDIIEAPDEFVVGAGYRMIARIGNSGGNGTPGGTNADNSSFRALIRIVYLGAFPERVFDVRESWVHGLAGGKQLDWVFFWNNVPRLSPGRYRLEVLVDADSEIDEINENNNVNSVILSLGQTGVRYQDDSCVTVGEACLRNEDCCEDLSLHCSVVTNRCVVEKPDLIVEIKDFPNKLHLDGEYRLLTVISNNGGSSGNADSSPFEVVFDLVDKDHPLKVHRIGETEVMGLGGGKKVDWLFFLNNVPRVPSGKYLLRAYVDSNYKINESNEDNNDDSDIVTVDSSCRDLEESCSGSNDCCSGFCSGGSCAEPTNTCVNPDACSDVSDCCGDFSCSEGLCVKPDVACVNPDVCSGGGCCGVLVCGIDAICIDCYDRGDRCSDNSQCCNGVCNDEGVCALPSCSNSGQCSSSDQCCSSRVCGLEEVCTSCYNKDNNCLSSDQCCGALVCGTEAICVGCYSTGASCTSKDQCCGEDDGAICRGGSCCFDDGGVCSTNEDCCSPFVCGTGGTCVQPTECSAAGVSGCSANVDCCGDYAVCSDSTCCSNTGGSCSGPEDCCTGLTCSPAGMCEEPSGCSIAEEACSNQACCGALVCGTEAICVGCYSTGASCTSKDQCCGEDDGAICRGGSCCFDDGGVCSTNEDCCSPFVCGTGGTCVQPTECSAAGVSGCSANVDCCDDAVCSDSTCCSNTGSSCSGPEDCCTGLTCNDTGVCEEPSGCSVVGEDCSNQACCADQGLQCLDNKNCFNCPVPEGGCEDKADLAVKILDDDLPAYFEAGPGPNYGTKYAIPVRLSNKGKCPTCYPFSRSGKSQSFEVKISLVTLGVAGLTEMVGYTSAIVYNLNPDDKLGIIFNWTYVPNTPGNYKIQAVVDSGGYKISDSDRTNNVYQTKIIPICYTEGYLADQKCSNDAHCCGDLVCASGTCVGNKPDLTVRGMVLREASSGTQVAGKIAPGTDYTITAHITNKGRIDTEGPFNVSLLVYQEYLSEPSGIKNYTIQEAIPAGGFKTLEMTFDVDSLSLLNNKKYTFAVTADTTEKIDELNERNNLNITREVTFSSLAELVVGYILNVPNPVVLGRDYTMTVKISNEGTRKAPASKIVLKILNGTGPDQNDVFHDVKIYEIETYDTPEIPAGSHTIQRMTFSLDPSTFDPGDNYWFLVNADVLGNVPEDNKRNNVITTQIVPVEASCQGQNFVCSNTLKCCSDENLKCSSVAGRYMCVTCPGEGDGCSTYNPCCPGKGLECANSLCVGTKPDLTVDGLILNTATSTLELPNTLVLGNSYYVSANINNKGGKDSSPFEAKLYIWGPKVPIPRTVETYQIDGISAGSSIPKRFLFYFDLQDIPAGNYWLVVRVDSSTVVDEINEQNNDNSTAPVTVPASCSSSGGSCSANVDCCQDEEVLVCVEKFDTDLQASYNSCVSCYTTTDSGCIRDDQCCSGLSCVAGSCVGSGKPDLVASLSSVPWSVTVGSTFNIGLRINNTGAANAGSSTARLYLVKDGSSTLVVSYSVGSISAGGFSSVTKSFTVPSVSAGSGYHFKLVADFSNSVSESDEGNNVYTTSSSVTVSGAVVNKPDLVVSTITDFSVSNPVVVGSRFSVTARIRNSGTSDALDSIAKLHMVRSSRSGTAWEIQSYNVGAIRAGSSLDTHMPFTVPSNLPPDTYHFRVEADSSRGVSESDERNNAYTTSSSVTVTGAVVNKPDLVVESITRSATSAVVGSPYSVTVKIRNDGAARASDSIAKLYMVSSGGSVTEVQSYNIGEIIAGSYSTRTMPFTVPDVSPGRYKFRVEADSSGGVSESDEGNNVYTTSSSVTVSGAVVNKPDLVVSTITDFSVSNPVVVGSRFSVTARIRNSGTSDALDSIAKLHMVRSSRSGTAWEIQSYNVGAIRAGSSLDTHMPFTVPSNLPPDTYHFRVEADSSRGVSESDERNNAYTTSSSVTVTGAVVNKPDLVVESITRSATSAVVGSPYSVTVKIRNDGAARASDSIAKLYMVSSGGSVTEVQSYNIGEIIAGSYSTRTMPFTVPDVSPGRYKFRVEADSSGGVSESDEGNNVYTTSSSVTVSGAVVNKPDLVVSTITDFSVSNPVVVGSRFSVTARIRNSGTSDALDSIAKLHMVRSSRSGTAWEIQSYNVGAIRAGSSLDTHMPFTVPSNLPPDTYHFRVEADSSRGVSESDERNNAYTTSSSVTVTGAVVNKPDLVVESITRSATSAVVGSPYSVTVKIRNDGAARASDSIAKLYMVSSGGSVTEVQSYNIGEIIAGSYSTRTMPFTVPDVSPGRYKFRVEADSSGGVSESDEGNNVYTTSSSVTVSGAVVNKPDLVVSTITDFSVSNPVVVGSRFSVTARIRNSGTSDALDSIAKLHMVRSSRSGTAWEIQSYNVGAIRAGSSLDTHMPFTVPSNLPPDTYHFRVEADSSRGVSESDERNNAYTTYSSVTVRPSCSSEGGRCASASCCANLVCQSYTCVSACQGAGGGCYSISCSSDECLFSTNLNANAYCNAKNANYECCIFDEFCDE